MPTSTSAISSSLLELILTCALPPVLSWLCQKNRVEQQLHEHLQDAMSFLKDVCEVLFLLDGAFFCVFKLYVPYPFKIIKLYKLQRLLKIKHMSITALGAVIEVDVSVKNDFF